MQGEEGRDERRRGGRRGGGHGLTGGRISEDTWAAPGYNGFATRMAPVERYPPYGDRPPYEDDRSYRGRSPSDRRGSKRMRSPSPRTGDLNPRFLPGDEPDNPENMNFKVTRRYLRDWLIKIRSKDADDDQAFERAWQNYELAYARRDAEAYFKAKQDEAWFKEKYDSSKSAVEVRTRNKAKGRSGKLQAFLAEFDSLKEVNFNYPEESQNASAITTAETASATSPSAAPVSEDTTAADAAAAATEAKDKGKDQSENGQVATSDFTTQEAGVDLVSLPGSDNKIFIREIDPEVSRAQLEEASQRSRAHQRTRRLTRLLRFAQILSKCASFTYLSLTEPIPNNGYVRRGWAVFLEATDAAKALKASPTLIPEPSNRRSKAAPSLASTATRIASDLDNIRRAALRFEKEEGDSRGSSMIEETFEKQKAEIESEEHEDVRQTKLDALSRRTLDLYLLYLRNVFNSCFYCLLTCEFPEELAYKCPKHWRRQAKPNAIRAKPDETLWMDWFDGKMPLFTSPDSINPTDFGGKDYDAAVEDMARKSYQEEEANKFRCLGCTKLFSAHKFIIKHLFTKHGETFNQEQLDEIKFFNNYALDPLRLPLAQHFDRFTEMGLKERAEQVKQAVPSSRLADRIGDKVESIPGSAGKKRRRGAGRGGENGKPLPPPPPPRGAKLDPRASRGMSYADLDNAPSGAGDDIVLNY
ncbi:hypothetical protein OIO90_001141 [Microbotryomycetes sp. JL221]|nr:hypothetical protein OIO90_001141 [Microbotryomycetes sp. JL221]